MAKRETEKVADNQDILATLYSKLKLDVYELPPDDIIQVIETPCPLVNKTIKGFARGYMTFVNGKESSGKTTFVLQTIAYHQAKNPNFKALIIDAEQAFNMQYAIYLGVDPNRTKVLRVLDFDDVFEILIGACCDPAKYSSTLTDNIFKNNFDMIMVDSIDALTLKEDLNQELSSKERLGLKAKAMSAALKKLLVPISRSKTAMVFINQFRDNVGGYGESDVVPGGNAQKFYAYLRLDMRNAGRILIDKRIIGHDVNLFVHKNKNGIPKVNIPLKMYFGTGFNWNATLLEQASEAGIVKKSGSWYSYEDTKLGQGFEAALSILDDNPELMEEIREKLALHFNG